MATLFSRALFALALLVPPLLISSHASFAQTSPPDPTSLTGQVLDEATQAPIPYASLGVLGRPVGTVADEQGRFSLAVPAGAEQDSLRLGLLGYAPRTTTVAAFRQQLAQRGGRVYLSYAPTQLREVVVRPGQLKRRVVGNSGNVSLVSAGFAVNLLGNQIAQGLHLRRPSLLEQVSFHVARCTYDSLFYRVNVYQVVDGQPTVNLLPEPVYVRVRKGEIKKRLVADLRRFNLTLQGDIAVALEMVKDLGPGTLDLGVVALGGPVYITDQMTNGWERARGVGIGIDATIVEYK